MGRMGRNVRQAGGFPGGSHCGGYWEEVVQLKGVETARVTLEAFNFGESESHGHVKLDL